MKSFLPDSGSAGRVGLGARLFPPLPPVGARKGVCAFNQGATPGPEEGVQSHPQLLAGWEGVGQILGVQWGGVLAGLSGGAAEPEPGRTALSERKEVAQEAGEHPSPLTLRSVQLDGLLLAWETRPGSGGLPGGPMEGRGFFTVTFPQCCFGVESFCMVGRGSRPSARPPITGWASLQGLACPVECLGACPAPHSSCSNCPNAKGQMRAVGQGGVQSRTHTSVVGEVKGAQGTFSGRGRGRALEVALGTPEL